MKRTAKHDGVTGGSKPSIADASSGVSPTGGLKRSNNTRVPSAVRRGSLFRLVLLAMALATLVVWSPFYFDRDPIATVSQFLPQQMLQQLPQSNTSAAYSAVSLLSRPLPSTATIHLPSQPLPTCANTIVMAYYNVKSKFKPESYRGWMKNSLSLHDCMVLYVQPDLVPVMQSLRVHAADKTVIVAMNLNNLPLADLHRHNSEFWQNQLDIDREKARHQSFHLFWIWLSKTWWVRTTITHNWFQSDFFLYSDIGCFRNGKYNDRQLIRRDKIDSLLPRDKVVWMAHRAPNAPPTPLWNDKFTQKQHYFHSGSQGAAWKQAWIQYHDAFATMVDAFLAANLFIGEDQCVLQGTCQANPNFCAYVPFDQVADNNYFGLRHVLHVGGDYNFWYMPPSKQEEAANWLPSR